MAKFIVTDAAKRPADAKATCCFYCRQPIGAAHKGTCVLIDQRVTVRAIIEYDVFVPAAWTADQIEFHRNEGSWCASNGVREIERVAKRLEAENNCPCGTMKYEFVCRVGEPMLNEIGRSQATPTGMEVQPWVPELGESA